MTRRSRLADWLYARLHRADGVAGVACVAAGAYLTVGLGVALLAVGAALLVSAWARS